MFLIARLLSNLLMLSALKAYRASAPQTLQSTLVGVQLPFKSSLRKSMSSSLYHGLPLGGGTIVSIQDVSGFLCDQEDVWPQGGGDNILGELFQSGQRAASPEFLWGVVVGSWLYGSIFCEGERSGHWTNWNIISADKNIPVRPT